MTSYKTMMAAALLALAACGGKAPESDAPPAPAENDAQRAARISLALQATPTKQDSVLTANNLTADELEQLIYRVAQDSTLSAEYVRLTSR